MKSKLLALFFRFGGISGKFLVVFLLTKNISLEFQGEYTLINTNIALLIIFLGLDFYVYSNRVIVKQVDKLVFIFKNSLVFYGIMYLFFVPVLIYMTHSGLVQKNLAVLFFFLPSCFETAVNVASFFGVPETHESSLAINGGTKKSRARAVKKQVDG